MIENIGGVGAMYWNPRSRRLPRPLGRVRYGKRMSNFGDLLGPMIMDRMLGVHRVGLPTRVSTSRRTPRLLAVGSILHFARDGDVVWGTGINGKIPPDRLRFRELDVRAVRGPRTRKVLMDLGVSVPQVFGDPALLVPLLFPEFAESAEKKVRKLALIPNLNDESRWAAAGDVVSPRGRPGDVIREILRSETVVTSSLHGLIVAESYGIPVALVKPERESDFKYQPIENQTCTHCDRHSPNAKRDS